MSLGSSRLKQFSLTAFFCCALVCCGGSGADNQTSSDAVSSVSSFVTLISPGTETQLIHLRWFPQNTDIGYAVKFRRRNHSTIDRFKIEPAGCTSEATTGYTSGVCTIDLPINEPTEFEVLVEAEIITGLPKDERRQLEKFTPITRY